MIEFQKMSEAEYLQFRKFSVYEYAKDLMNGENLDRETALKKAESEFGEMLYDGPDTEDHFVMTIRDVQRGKEVGWIWYCYETDEEDKQQVFLCDFLIFENERRKGYASAALAEMERRAKADGGTAAALFVWDHNAAGAALYKVRIRSGRTGFWRSHNEKTALRCDPEMN